MVVLQNILNTTIGQETELLLSKLKNKSRPFNEAYYYALLNFSLYEILEDEKYLFECSKEINNILEKDLINSSVVSIKLVGIALLGQILVNKGLLNDIDQLKKLDERLFKDALNQLNHHSGENHCLIHTVNYFSESINNIRHVFFVEELSNQIVKTLRDDEFGCKIIYKGQVDLTFPFGMIGMLLSLLKIFHNTSDSILKNTIDNGIAFILNYKSEVDFSENLFNFFPDKVLDEGRTPVFSNQMSLSLGDLAKALLLYQYAKTFNNQDILKLTNFVGLNTLLRKSENQHFITNSSFLHGSSGVALIYQKLYNLTHIEAYQKGYDFWINKTHELCNKESKSLYLPEISNHILDDIVNLKLTLLSCQSSKPLSWERLYGLQI